MSRLGWLRFGVLAGSIGALEILCRSGAIKRLVMIPPSEMALELWKILLSGKANHDMVQTFTCVAAALALAVLAGFFIGLALHALPRLRAAVNPLLGSWYAVPFFVFYPLLVAVFGLTMLPVIVIAFLFAVVTMVINTLNGLDRVPRVLDKVARAHRMGPFATLLRLKLPAAAPNLFTGVKLAVAYSFIGVIASEFILASSGLGYAIAYAYNNFDNRTMYALMLFVLGFVTTINMLLYMWEGRMMRRRQGR